MFTHKVVADLVGDTAAIAGGAVAIARSSADTNTSSFSKAQPLAAKRSFIDWPHGCRWHPATQSESNRSSVRRSGRGHLKTNLLGKLVR